MGGRAAGGRGPGRRPRRGSRQRDGSRRTGRVAAVSGPGGGGRPGRSRPAGSLERDRERRLEDRHPRTRLELAGGHRRSRVRDDRRQRRRRARPDQGALRPGHGERLRGLENEHRWVLYDIDFHTGASIRWGARALPGHAAGEAASQEHVRFRDPGHRRPPRLRLLRRHRTARGVQPERRGRLVHGARRLQHDARDGHRGLAHPARRPRLHRQRQHDAVVRRGLRQGHGARGLAARAGRAGPELVDAVRLGARAAHGAGDGRHAGRPLLRPRRGAALGAARDVGADHPDAVHQPRARLHQLRLPGRRPASRCTRSGRVRRATSPSSPRSRCGAASDPDSPVP